MNKRKETTQPLQRPEVRKTLVRYLRVGEVQGPEPFQPFEMGQAFIRHASEGEDQLPEAGQSLEVDLAKSTKSRRTRLRNW